ncbi:MAG: translocation/assembly module TamB [Bacteroidales bacterium]|jgi:hypothetical protein|nr:translocation/assembly module TamB [Bacteroidales bacterium]
MEKVKKKSKKWVKFFSILGGIVLFFLILFLNSSWILTHIVRKYLNDNAQKVGMIANIGAINLHFFPLEIKIDNVFLADSTQIILNVADIDAKIKKLSLHELVVDNISLNKGVVYLKKEDSIINLTKFIDVFNTGKKTNWKLDFFCNTFNLRNVTLSYINVEQRKKNNENLLNGNGVASKAKPSVPDSIVLNNINFGAEIISFQQDSLQAHITNFAIKIDDKNELKNLSGYFLLTPTVLSLEKFNLKTQNSNLDFDVDIHTHSYQDYKNFVDKCNFNIHISHANINSNDLALFVPQLAEMDEVVEMKGVIKGKVNDLSCENLQIDYGKNTQFSGNIHLSGLPDVKNAKFHSNDLYFTSNQSDISHILQNKFLKKNFPEKLNSLKIITLHSKIDGSMSHIDFDVKVNTNVGSLASNGSLKQSDKLVLNGKFSADKILIDKFFDSIRVDVMYPLSLTGDFYGYFKNKNDYSLDFNAVIPEYAVLQQKISNILINSKLDKKHITCHIALADNQGDADIETEIYFNDDSLKSKNISFNVQLDSFNLTKYKIVKQKEPIFLSTKLVGEIADIDFKRKDFYNAITAVLIVDNVNMMFPDTTLQFKNILASVRNISKGKHLQIRSDYFDIDMSGDYSIPMPIPQKLDEWLQVKEEFLLTAKIKNFESIFSYILPDMHVANGGRLRINNNSESSEETEWDINFEDIDYRQLHIDYVKAKAERNEHDSLYALFEVSNLTTGKFQFIDFAKMKVNISNDLKIFDWNFLAKCQPQTYPLDIDISGFINILQGKRIEAGIVASKLNIENTCWHFNNENKVIIDSNGVEIKEIMLQNIENQEQWLHANGFVSKKTDKPLDVTFNNFDLTILNILYDRINMFFSGLMSGTVQFTNSNASKKFNLDLDVEDFTINDFKYGTLCIKADDNKNQIDLRVQLDDSTCKYVDAKGYFNKDDVSIYLHSDLKCVDMSIIKGWVSTFSNHLYGKADGELTLSGKLVKPEIFNIHAVPRVGSQMGIAPTNVIYEIQGGSIDVSLSSIDFNTLNLKDLINKNSKATLYGQIVHRRFRPSTMKVDLHGTANKALTLDLKQGMVDILYGKAIATGTFGIVGIPEENIVISAKAKTERGTYITIPYTSSVNISDANFITFTNRAPLIADTDNRRMARRRERQETTIDLIIDLDITPDATLVLNMNIPPTVGYINANAIGNVKIDIDNMERVSILGTCVLQEGFYDFDMMQSVIKKRFVFDPGGTISWSGDVINNAAINFSGTYSTKASLAPVLSGDEAISINKIPRGKVNVQSVILLSNHLNQPEIEFGFRLPGVDEDLKNEFLSLVERDQNEITKQTFSLLLLNSFSPIGNSTSFATTSSAVSFTTEALSNQLNNFLSKLDLKIGDIDLPQVGVNFRPEDENYSPQVEVSLSSQFLNNRLIIDGNLGYGGTSKIEDPSSDGTRTSAFLGEFNAEYRIFNNLSAKMFNRPNEKNTPGAYSQGLGLGYKIDFDEKKKKNNKTPALSKKNKAKSK